MPETLDLSQNYQIGLIGPDKMTTLIEGDALLACAPPMFSDTGLVVWEQPENGYGLLSLRGQGGVPDTTKVQGYRQMRMAPGFYGENVLISEAEMNDAREYGTPNEPMDVEKRLAWIQDSILKRAVDRMRVILSVLFRSGQFVIVSSSGSATHADTLDGYAARNVFTPAIGWAANPTIAQPIDDLQTWRNALQLGTDSTFDEDSTLLASDPTITDILATKQIREQIKVEYGNTVAGLKKLNDLLKVYGLPSIERYNEDYYATEAAAKARTGAIRFIPAKSLIWKGNRKDKAQPANFQLTRNAIKNPPVGVAQNSDGYKWSPGRSGIAAEIEKGLYTIVQYEFIPPQYKVDIGFNGGPAVRFPSAFAGISYT